MLIFIYCFSLLILAASFILLIKPTIIMDFIQTNAELKGLYGIAILARLILGLALITLAEISRYPLVITAIGWIAIISAVVFIIMGSQQFAAMMKWMSSRVRPWARVGGIAGILFGAFLLHAFA